LDFEEIEDLQGFDDSVLLEESVGEGAVVFNPTNKANGKSGQISITSCDSAYQTLTLCTVNISLDFLGSPSAQIF